MRPQPWRTSIDGKYLSYNVHDLMADNIASELQRLQAFLGCEGSQRAADSNGGQAMTPKPL